MCGKVIGLMLHIQKRVRVSLFVEIGSFIRLKSEVIIKSDRI